VGDRLAAGAPVTVPVRVTVCVLPEVLFELSVTTSGAVRVPCAVGLKITLMVQLALAATELPQVLVSPKSPLLVPETHNAGKRKSRSPAVGKYDRLGAAGGSQALTRECQAAGHNSAIGTLEPVPVRLTVWVLPETPFELSVTVSVAVLVPVAVGLKYALMLQLALAATEVPHVLVSLKSPLLAPEIATLVTAKAADPVLERVTTWAALLVFKV